jgi:hypothetical protein
MNLSRNQLVGMQLEGLLLCVQSEHLQEFKSPSLYILAECRLYGIMQIHPLDMDRRSTIVLAIFVTNSCLDLIV